MYGKYIKRGFDILLSFCGLAVLLPLFLIISVLVKIDSPGPVLFKQRRIGKDKKEFLILKFRSMHTDAPRDVATHLLEDSRSHITRIGAFLRKTSLDELPQLINILKGEMSVVGPRPALYNQYDLIEERDKYGANALVPGLTGWAQINGRDELPIHVKAYLDGYYAKHLSFWMDLKCFLGTFAVVLGGKGIVEGVRKGRKKILIITNHSYMLYRFRLELIEKLAEEHEVILSMPFVGHEEDFQKLGLRCIETKLERRGMNPIKDYSLIKEYRLQLKEIQPDLVITFSIKPNIYAGWLCGQERIPYAAVVQGLGSAFERPFISRLVSLLYRTALRKAMVVFFENETDAKFFVEKNLVSFAKIKVLPGAGVNLENYEYKPYPKNELFRFAYIGRIMREKGISELFEACQRLRDKGYKFILDMVGFYEDELKDDYKKEVDRQVIQGHVNDHGFKEDPRPYYDMADCIVMPSYHEGMSNVVLEAAAMGRPVITTDIPGCREAVDDKVSGLLVKLRDTDSLTEAMESVLKMSRKERTAMGVKGREKMEECFDKKKVVEETIGILPL
jgi:lipopolysaccharide/colanic/teichoic acid biosynthesis glycosyltransferase